MKTDEQLWEVTLQIYRQLYKEATPSADFDAMLKSGEAAKPQFFMKYYLPDTRTAKIIETVCKKHKLDKRDAQRVEGSIWLGSSPTGIKKEDQVGTIEKPTRKAFPSDKKVHEFWAKWERLYQNGDETAMEEHVSSMMACKIPKTPVSDSLMAGMLNTYFMDLAKYLMIEPDSDKFTRYKTFISEKRATKAGLVLLSAAIIEFEHHDKNRNTAKIKSIKRVEYAIKTNKNDG